MTRDTIAVVKPYYRIEEAYSMGHDEFSDVEADSAEEIEFSHFTESARWANIIAPDLRAMAGYADAGHGTYREGRQIAAIKPGCEEDEPAEAYLMDADSLYESLVDAYRMGAYDGVEDTYDPEAATHDW
jgi:hypothetical protein